jgi:4a-hydroxytetrahydrobiopterin dehydratase
MRFRQEAVLIYIMPALTHKQIKAGLKVVSNWSESAQTISRTFKFEGFLNTIAFVNRIIREAKNFNHHPDIDIRFDRVTLTLPPLGDGGITEKDFSVARRCDEVFFRFFAFRPMQITSQRSERNVNKDCEMNMG